MKFTIKGWLPESPGGVPNKDPDHLSQCETADQVESYIHLMLETNYRTIRIEKAR